MYQSVSINTGQVQVSQGPELGAVAGRAVIDHVLDGEVGGSGPTLKVLELGGVCDQVNLKRGIRRKVKHV